MFEIANYWLNDTRAKMLAAKEKHGNPWFSEPGLHPFDSTKPWVDEKGRALEALQNIYFADIKGPYSDKALALMGAVNFYDQDYKEADHEYTLLLEQHPNSDLAQASLRYAVISKNMSTGGADYDGRKAAEARKLVDTLLNQYGGRLTPEQAEKLAKLKGTISYQQAEKDFKVADFYEHVGKLASAYFCFEIVRRRYPESEFAKKAEKRMYEIRDKVQKEAGKSLPPVEPASGAVQPVPSGQQPPVLPLAPTPIPDTLPAPQGQPQ
jgi:hypothetical protein